MSEKVDVVVGIGLKFIENIKFSFCFYSKDEGVLIIIFGIFSEFSKL